MKFTLLKIGLLVGLYFCCLMPLTGQVIKSNKSSIRLNTLQQSPDYSEPDSVPPSIKINYPEIYEGVPYKSTMPNIILLGTIVDESGISSLSINGNIHDLAQTGRFSLPLSLRPGDNLVSVIAMDTKENVIEYKYIISYQPRELTLKEKATTEGRYYALIIGINNYDDPVIEDLENPLWDAQRLYDILHTNYTFEEGNMSFLENPTRTEIETALFNLSKMITMNDNLLIFFAGHGLYDEEADIGYWLPSDAKRNNPAQWFRNSTLVDYLKMIKSKHTLLIADACFAGSIFNTRSVFPDAPKAINRLYELPSRKAMASGMKNEEVPDKSIFIKYLIERLKDNSEDYLSSEQLFYSFRHAVMNNTDVMPKFGEIQNVGDEGGDFIFIKK